MIRLYLSQWIDESEPGEPFNMFPAIYSAIEATRGQWSALDLRVAEDQKQSRGWCLVEADVTDLVHAQVIASGGVWIDPQTVTRTDLLNRIGVEGLPDTPDLRTIDGIKRALVDTHRARVDRWKGRDVGVHRPSQ